MHSFAYAAQRMGMAYLRLEILVLINENYFNLDLANWPLMNVASWDRTAMTSSKNM